MTNLVSLGFSIIAIRCLKQRGRQESINSTSNPEQEYICFMECRTRPYACYIHLHKVNIPLYQFSMKEKNQYEMEIKVYYG